MPVLVICGATATGKTALAVECAKKLNTEIISADSMLVYKGFDVGAAKPTKEEMCGVVHHLIDVVEPKQSFSVSDYERLALPIVEDLLAKGKTPVICGGTGFYINSLLFKSGFGGAPADETVRKKYEKICAERGAQYLHDLLREKDEITAEKLHPNDVKRVIRALEIYDVTGKRKSEQNDLPVPRFPFQSICIDFPRETLYGRIDRRVDLMFDAGLKAEVTKLMEQGVGLEHQAMQGIGYKEVVAGILRAASDDEIKEEIKKNTRNYAKRQITFFKRMQNNVFLPADQATAENVLALLKQE